MKKSERDCEEFLSLTNAEFVVVLSYATVDLFWSLTSTELVVVLNYAMFGN